MRAETNNLPAEGHPADADHPTGDPCKVSPFGANLGTVYVRYQNVDTGKVEEISRALGAEIVKARTPASDPRLYLAACAAEFAEILRGSEHARDGSLAGVERLLDRVAKALPLDGKVRELLSLVRRAKSLRGER